MEWFQQCDDVVRRQRLFQFDTIASKSVANPFHLRPVLVGCPPSEPRIRAKFQLLIRHISQSFAQMIVLTSTNILTRLHPAHSPLHPLLIAAPSHCNYRVVVRACAPQLLLNLDPITRLGVTRPPRSRVRMPKRSEPVEPKESNGTGGKQKNTANQPKPCHLYSHTLSSCQPHFWFKLLPADCKLMLHPSKPTGQAQIHSVAPFLTLRVSILTSSEANDVSWVCKFSGQVA